MRNQGIPVPGINGPAYDTKALKVEADRVPHYQAILSSLSFLAEAVSALEVFAAGLDCLPMNKPSTECEDCPQTLGEVLRITPVAIQHNSNRIHDLIAKMRESLY